ncbi:MAG: J domain-containing protein [Candidatus Limnocylindrales bacterium]
MPPRSPRPTLPTDDLYGRLGLPADASFEAIEIAWRGLLRRYHPDVAGPAGLDPAKRINVAHDWLSDPELRAQYDRALGVTDDPAQASRVAARPAWGSPAPRHRPLTTAQQVAAVIERVGRLSADDLDRLGLAEPAPIAFLATLRRFVTPELMAQLDAAELAVSAALPPAARRVPAMRDAVVGRVAELILAELLDELLGDPAGERARERLTRGWDAAVGQPRYGPATATVVGLLDRLAHATTTDLRWLAGTGARERIGEPPWPDATSRDEDETLRVSSELAARDAQAAASQAGASSSARRAAARIAHLLVLRHAFAASVFDRHAAPWLGTWIQEPLATGPRVRARP